MISHPKPTFDFAYDVDEELKALRRWRRDPDREIPSKAADRLLVATWNVANLGQQKRRDSDYRLLAEVCSWFEVIALQEIADDLSGLRALTVHVPARYRALVSDKAGNNERLGFVYDATKVELLEKVAEIGVPADELDEITLPGVASPFTGFSRNPYVASFAAGSFRFLLATVHSLFGEEGEASSLDRRRLETYAVARWADLRRRSKYAYTRDILCLGDFNLPRAEPGDGIYEALRSRGLRLPPHSTAIGPGSSIATDSHYDQIAFFPGESAGEFTGRMGVFDFDHAVFAKLWQTKTPKQFASYVRYYLSDHRPLWAEFAI